MNILADCEGGRGLYELLLLLFPLFNEIRQAQVDCKKAFWLITTALGICIYEDRRLSWPFLIDHGTIYIYFYYDVNKYINLLATLSVSLIAEE